MTTESFTAKIKGYIETHGLKRLVQAILSGAGVIDSGMAGQVVIHVNNGGVTKIVKTAEVK